MPFTLSEMQADDVDEFAELDAAAMGHTDIGQAMEIDSQTKQGKPRIELIRGWMEMALKKKDDPNAEGVWIKITDSESGRMVAAAAWIWQLDPEQLKKSLHEIAASEKKVEAAEAKEENPSVYAAMSKEWATFRAEHFPQEPYCNLQVCLTHPDWERQGAGSIMVQYGCDRADEAGVICVLTASPKGYGLYLKHGFQVVRDTELDLRPYGVDMSARRRAMIRRPKSSQ